MPHGELLQVGFLDLLAGLLLVAVVDLLGDASAHYLFLVLVLIDEVVQLFEATIQYLATLLLLQEFNHAFVAFGKILTQKLILTNLVVVQGYLGVIVILFFFSEPGAW